MHGQQYIKKKHLPVSGFCLLCMCMLCQLFLGSNMMSVLLSFILCKLIFAVTDYKLVSVYVCM